MWGNKKYVTQLSQSCMSDLSTRKMTGNTDELFDIFGLKFLHINLYVEYGG